MQLKIIKLNTETHGIGASILLALEALNNRKKNELIYLKFNNLIYSNKFNLWDKFFIQPFAEYEDVIEEKIKKKNYTIQYAQLKKGSPLNYIEKDCQKLRNPKIIEPLRLKFKKYIVFNNSLKEKFLKFKSKFLKHKTISVHLRGMDRFRAGEHFANKRNNIDFLSTIRPSIIKTIDKFNINKIFLATDDEQYLKQMKLAFKKKIIKLNSTIFANSKTDRGVHNNNIWESETHKNKLATEAILDSIIMSNCNYSLLSQSNISIMTLLMRNDYNYDFLDKHMKSVPYVKVKTWN
jgi:hypothetical protein